MSWGKVMPNKTMLTPKAKKSALAERKTTVLPFTV
jgi:hypothetical protein